jgi:hypothetical protein
MITVKVNQYVKCNTIGNDPSAGHEGVLERIMDTEEDRAYGWGPDYGMVDGIPCNLHNCEPWSPIPYITPALTLEMVLEGETKGYYSREVIEVLEVNGFKQLGWLNGGLVPPALDDWEEVYHNDTGSYCIVISPSTKQIYCVDMGD